MVKTLSEKEKIYHFIEDIFDDITEDFGLTTGNAELSTFHEANETQWFTLEGKFGHFAKGEIHYSEIMNKSEDVQYATIVKSIILALKDFEIPETDNKEQLLTYTQDKIYFHRKATEIAKEIA